MHVGECAKRGEPFLHARLRGNPADEDELDVLPQPRERFDEVPVELLLQPAGIPDAGPGHLREVRGLGLRPRERGVVHPVRQELGVPCERALALQERARGEVGDVGPGEELALRLRGDRGIGTEGVLVVHVVEPDVVGDVAQCVHELRPPDREHDPAGTRAKQPVPRPGQAQVVQPVGRPRRTVEAGKPGLRGILGEVRRAGVLPPDRHPAPEPCGHLRPGVRRAHPDRGEPTAQASEELVPGLPVERPGLGCDRDDPDPGMSRPIAVRVLTRDVVPSVGGLS